jgi:putative two-component system response regulator
MIIGKQPPGFDANYPTDIDDPISAQLFRVTDDFRTLFRERQVVNLDLDQAHEEILLRLALAAECRSGEASAHLLRIGEFAALLAEVTGQSESYCRDLRRAAPLHDLGKIGMPDVVLNKPGRLNENDWRIMRRHPEIGARLLSHSGIPLLDMAADVALFHHERYDGLGYPQGVWGRDIPLCGRIVGLVDFFDALTQERAYRKAVPDKKALSMVQACGGGHFDPTLVEAFMDNQDRFLAWRDAINQTAQPSTALDLAA